jgi:hypothetical protein
MPSRAARQLATLRPVGLAGQKASSSGRTRSQSSSGIRQIVGNGFAVRLVLAIRSPPVRGRPQA